MMPAEAVASGKKFGVSSISFNKAMINSFFVPQRSAEMEIAIVAGLFAKRNMDINAGQVDLFNE
jgi:hypothetical protein